MELIMTVCLILIAIDPVKKMWRDVHNWNERREIHRAHLTQLEKDQR